MTREIDGYKQELLDRIESGYDCNLTDDLLTFSQALIDPSDLEANIDALNTVVGYLNNEDKQEVFALKGAVNIVPVLYKLILKGAEAAARVTGNPIAVNGDEIENWDCRGELAAIVANSEGRLYYRR